METALISNPAEFNHCTRKVPYKDKRMADQAAQRTRRKTGIKSIAVYHCGYCGQYHIGKEHNKRL